jgi:hypothetical protein
MQGRPFLNVAVGEHEAVLELLSPVDEALVAHWNALPAPDHALDQACGVPLADIQCDSFARRDAHSKKDLKVFAWKAHVECGSIPDFTACQQGLVMHSLMVLLSPGLLPCSLGLFCQPHQVRLLLGIVAAYW